MLLFGLWYFELDRGGPMAREFSPMSVTPDFLFVQMGEEAAKYAPEGWSPRLVDYLYTSFTNAIAIQPDRHDAAHCASEAADERAVARLAVTTVGLVIARAVNILQ